MLTRLRVDGFKNLVNTDIRFGPVTAIAGLNGVGKSNVFDAIQFLSLLADKTFVEAARDVRGGGEILELFSARRPGAMRFEAELLIPRSGEDDFNQPARASATLLKYVIELVAEDDSSDGLAPRIRLRNEELSYLAKSDAEQLLGFPHSPHWRDQVVVSFQRRISFIKTESTPDGGCVVRLQSDRMPSDSSEHRGGGKAKGFSAENLPRTVLSSAQNAEETRTAVLVRREMRAWRQLQLEPSALRRPDDFHAESRLTSAGEHLPATLFRLAQQGANGRDSDAVFATVANQLARAVDDVRAVRVDRDEGRRLLRFMMKDNHGLELPASSLSDGTLRLVALAVLREDPSERGVLCLEEPENGVHPQRIQAMVELLYDIAVDPNEEADETNPLRQVIVSTHSPLVAGHVRADDLVFAFRAPSERAGHRMSGLTLAPVDASWRLEEGKPRVSHGAVRSYLAGQADIDVSPFDGESVYDRFGQKRLSFNGVGEQ